MIAGDFGSTSQQMDRFPLGPLIISFSYDCCNYCILCGAWLGVQCERGKPEAGAGNWPSQNLCNSPRVRLRQLPTELASEAFTMFWNLSSEKSPSCIHHTAIKHAPLEPIIVSITWARGTAQKAVNAIFKCMLVFWYIVALSLSQQSSICLLL